MGSIFLRIFLYKVLDNTKEPGFHNCFNVSKLTK